MTTLTVSHVSKQFAAESGDGPARAVDDVSFKLASGEVLALLGPSGCGKSTLLRIVAGLIQADAGEVLYDGVPLPAIPLESRGIGMVFQDGALVPHWAARKSIGFFLSLRKREDEVPERVRRISQVTGFGMDALLDRRPAQLSGGERQRVGIARALARDPRIFLFDEPFSNIDAKLRAQARLELRRLLNEFPVTSIYVTHDQVEAIALAHRIAVMRVGRIEQIGSYFTLHDNPVNSFVAAFVGSPPINLIPGRADDGRWAGAGLNALPIRRDLPAGARVLLGIRPDRLRIEPPGTDGAQASVDAVFPNVADRNQLMEVTLAGQPIRLLAPYEPRYNPGDTIGLSVDPDAALFFDPATGQRIG